MKMKMKMRIRTDDLAELLLELVLALLLGYVADEELAVGHADVHAYVLARSDLVVVE